MPPSCRPPATPRSSARRWVSRPPRDRPRRGGRIALVSCAARAAPAPRRRLFLRDAGSRNGTWVNDALVTLPHPLSRRRSHPRRHHRSPLHGTTPAPRAARRRTPSRWQVVPGPSTSAPPHPRRARPGQRLRPPLRADAARRSPPAATPRAAFASITARSRGNTRSSPRYDGRFWLRDPGIERRGMAATGSASRRSRTWRFKSTSVLARPARRTVFVTKPLAAGIDADTRSPSTRLVSSRPTHRRRRWPCRRSSVRALRRALDPAGHVLHVVRLPPPAPEACA